MNKKVYFAGSIRGGREDAALYRDIIRHIQETDIVLTEHIGATDLNARCSLRIFSSQSAPAPPSASAMSSVPANTTKNHAISSTARQRHSSVRCSVATRISMSTPMKRKKSCSESWTRFFGRPEW